MIRVGPGLALGPTFFMRSSLLRSRLAWSAIAPVATILTMLKTRVLPLLLLTILFGCSSGRTYQFEVVVKNETKSTLSAGLVKDGPPLEAKWDSPEQIAIGAPGYGTKHWGTPVPPGESRTLGPQTGKLEGDTTPFVRVYRGDLTINELMAISRGSPDRTSIPVPSGPVEVVVKEDAGMLVIPEMPRKLDPAKR